MWKSLHCRLGDARTSTCPTVNTEPNPGKRLRGPTRQGLIAMRSSSTYCISNLYQIKHPTLKEANESELLNSIPVEKCRRCGSIELKKSGTTSNGIQRYWCKSCKRTFTVTTNTLLENHKIPVTEWIEFLLGIFRRQSFSSVSKTNRNTDTTTGYWLAKLYLVLEAYQDGIILSDDVQIDETYYSVIKKDIKVKEDGKKFRGTLKEQYLYGYWL